MKEQLAGKTVVGILSGGNLDLRELGRIMREESPLTTPARAFPYHDRDASRTRRAEIWR